MGRLEHRAQPPQDEARAQTLTRRWYAYFMGKRQDKHPFEDNAFLDGFSEWMGSAEGELSGAEKWIDDHQRQAEAARKRGKNPHS